MFINQPSGEKVKSCFVVYTNYHGVSIPTLADVKLPIQSWEEIYIICSREPTPAMTELPTIRKNELWAHMCYRRGRRGEKRSIVWPESRDDPLRK